MFFKEGIKKQMKTLYIWGTKYIKRVNEHNSLTVVSAQ